MTMKKLFPGIFVPVLLLLFSLEGNAAFYKSQTIKEKTAHRDLTFTVTFDSRGTRAEKAAGSPVSSLPGLDMGLRGIVGFDNQQGFEPIGEEELFYKADKNISPAAGTLSFWVSALNYHPSEALTDGKSRNNIALFELFFQRPGDHLHFRLYEFKENLYFDIWEKGVNNPTQPLVASRKKIRQKEWHQITLAWTSGRYEIYLNGEFVHGLPLSERVSEKMRSKWDMSKSRFGIPLKVWGQKRNHRVLFDDIKVYKRMLSKTEIRRLYAEVDTSVNKKDIALLELAVYGVDKTRDQVDLFVDSFSLPDKYAARLAKGPLSLHYTMEGPGGLRKKGNFVIRKKRENVRLKGIDKVGKYTIRVSLKDGKKLIPAGKVAFDRPDLSFMGNKIGITGKVPHPFTPLVLKGNTVKIWNREYRFGSSPFPEKILVKGKDLLVKAPQLVIELEKGKKVPLKYRMTSRKHTVREAVFKGEGTFGPKGKYKIFYTTKAAYDGMIHIDWMIAGKPVIKSMYLEYQQNTAFTQHLMTPRYQKKSPFAFPYSRSTWTIPHMIWMVTENLGGMAYTVAHDANWIYKEKEDLFLADRKTGKVTVKMITSKTRIPENTPYHALFTVTPTRPFHPKSHLLRLGQAIYREGRRKELSSVSQKPGLSYNLDEKWYEDKFFASDEDESRLIYGMADSVTTLDKVGLFFARDYDVPGSFAYTFNESSYDPVTKKVRKIKSNSLAACAATSAKDYLLWNQRKITHGRFARKIWGIYYDLSGNDPCSNPHHDCGFKDRFGRSIVTRTLLFKRELFERTLVMVREKKKILFLHAQKDFNPFMHSFGDYWYPGEENNGLTQNNLNCYCDDIRDANWQTEYNTNVLGVNVVFLGASAAWRKHVAEQLIGQCLLHNIEFSTAWMPGGVLSKVWNLCEDFETDKAAFFRYDKQKKILSSDPDLKISYYKPKTGKKLLVILMNRRPYEVTAQVDFSGVGIKDSGAKDVYWNKDYSIKNGLLSLKVAPRTFMMLWIPPRGFYPYRDNGSIRAGQWKPKKSSLKFHVTPAKRGKGRVFTLIAEKGKNNEGCFTMNPAAKPGKTYTFKLKVKGENLNPGAKMNILILAQAARATIGAIPGGVRKAVPGKDWQEYTISGKVPGGAVWDKTVRLQFTMSSENLKTGKISFKDVVMDEK